MIKNKNDLTDYISKDNDFLRPKNIKKAFIAKFACYPTEALRKYLFFLRKQEYYINTANGSKFKGFMGLVYERKKNRLGTRLGIEIGPNCFGRGLSIWHVGDITVHSDARIGDYCTLHGGNCIGNNGKTNDVPVIGNHVDIGYGAVIIGNVRIADNVTIGANAVITKSILESGSVVAGVPGKVLKKEENK